MRTTQVLLSLGIVLLLALILWSALESSVLPGLTRVASTRWGLTTLADLGLGFCFAAAWMASVLGPRRAWPWILGLIVFGNLSLLMLLALRARRAKNLAELLGSSHA